MKHLTKNKQPSSSARHQAVVIIEHVNPKAQKTTLWQISRTSTCFGVQQRFDSDKKKDNFVV